MSKKNNVQILIVVYQSTVYRKVCVRCTNRIKTISSFPFAHAKKVTRTFTFDTHKDAIYFFNGMKGKQFDEPKGSKVNYLIEIWDVL
ncbi:unnamed protein product [Rhizophagus irregularis]|nr:unnamed protein product [Rhizophagus irregularis]CAB5194282.1 unnamed protein product [Rhizophagus irregularis]